MNVQTTAEVLAGFGTLVFSADSSWSPHACALLGVPSDAEPTLDLLQTRVCDSDWERVSRWIEQLGASPAELDCRDVQGHLLQLRGSGDEETKVVVLQRIDHGGRIEVLEEVQRLAGVGSFVWDVDQGMISWSPELYSITGVAADFVPTVASFDALVHPEDVPALQAKRERMLMDGTDPGHECRIVRPDGTIRHLVLRVRHVVPGGVVVGAIQDVTETRRMLERLERGQLLEAAGRMAAGVAHDFRNLLSVILANGTLLEAEFGDRPELIDLFRAGQAGQELTQRLLAVADGHRLPVPTPFDLDARLRSGTSLVLGALTSKIQLNLELGGPPAVLADARMFDNLLLNLVLNAVDAMSAGGTLTLRTGVDGDGRGWMEVIDTGVGMSEEVRSRATQPFFSTKGGDRVGSGLGLSMVQTAIDQIDGGLDLTSSPGVGTTVRLTFPVAPPLAEGAPDLDVAETAGAVLVVEDDDDVRRLVTRILSRMGFRVHEAAGPAEIPGFLAHPLDLVLCDVKMPDGGGAAVLQSFAAARPDVRFVFMTGFTHNAEWLRSQVVVDKPFMMNDLIGAVRKALVDPWPRPKTS